MIYQNEDEFEGNFKEDKKEGYGTYKFKSGDLIKAKYINDKTINGIIQYINGDIYEGDLENYNKEGNGCMKYYNCL